ncbi:ulp1 protease family, C-terminal catalytic domain-containing protein [Tanacetum coccineum]
MLFLKAMVSFAMCGLIVVSRYLYGDTFKASFIPLSFAPIKEGSRINSNMGSIVEGGIAFRDRVFPNISNVKGDMLYKILNNQSNFDKLLDDDVVVLVAPWHSIGSWNDFPWGEHMWIELHHRVYNNDKKYREVHLNKIAIKGKTFMPTYTLQGLCLPLKDTDIGNKSRVKRKLVGSDTHVSTDDDRDVDLSPDVHHDVDEGLSVQDLTKKSRVKRKLVGSDTHVRTGDDREVDLSPDVQHDVDEAVNQHKTSKIGSDSDGSNVFSTTMEFDPDYFSCLTENPHNRVALTKKITDMEVQFQRRITLIEEYLKMPRSAHLEKSSNVDAECGSDVKAGNKESMCVDSSPNLEKMSNVAAECMFVDPNPSCGSDVNAGKKESMCVDSSVKTSCATDLNGNTFHSDSMDVDPDRKALDDQHVSANNLKGAEKIAVETLLKIIDFDVPKENQSPIQPLMTESLVEGFKTGETSKSSTTDPQSHMYVEECNDDKVRRDAKMSKYLLSPFMIPPESTQRVHKLRPRNKKTKKMGMRLTARDGKFIPEWTEDLFRPKHAPKTQTIVPTEISVMLQENKDQCFYFPWMESSIVSSVFWERLLGIGTERRGWLSDTLSCCYVDGVTYGVPWFADSVEKAYFPINGEDNHWVLAELHIRSGVITLYDSLPPQNTLVESREWWLDMRKCYAEKFPKLLIEFDNGKEKH